MMQAEAQEATLIRRPLLVVLFVVVVVVCGNTRENN